MPNRIIKESTFTSDRISALSDFEFRVWVGLITQADDAGRGDARPAIIKGRVFALRERVTDKGIENALRALAVSGCIYLYKVDGKPYYQFPSWAKHQRVRNAQPKYPGPENGEVLTVGGESRQVAASRGEKRPKSNPIQSESESNPNPIEAQECADRSPLEIAMDDFAKARKLMKKPLGDKARELTLKELQRLAPDDDEKKIAILEQSIQRGWMGVFPLKEEKKGTGPAMKTSYDGIRQKMDGDDLDRLATKLGVDG